MKEVQEVQESKDPLREDMVRSIIDTGELRVEGRFVDASNATLYGIITVDPHEIPVIYKPIAGERPLWDFPDGNLAQRERAAYVLSELLSFNVVPYTILRDGPFGLGMVQEWIAIDESIDIVSVAQSDDPQIRNLALFDAMINNTDRKYGHILPDSSGKLFACDHGVTFHQDDKLRTVIWQFAGEPFTDDELDTLAKARKLPAKNFSTLISAKEIKALRSRIDRLLDTSRFPLPSQEWPAVPWPPF